MLIKSPFKIKITGDPSLSKRDFSRVIVPLKKFGVKLFRCKVNDNNIDLKEILIKIKKLGINYLLVEGGYKYFW